MEENHNNPAGAPSADQARNDEIEKAREELRRIIAEPIDEAEARRTLADIDLQKAQLTAYTASLAGQVAQATAQMAALDCDAAVIRRRLLNAAGETAK